jgi:FixJ family two-component response regulator
VPRTHRSEVRDRHWRQHTEERLPVVHLIDGDHHLRSGLEHQEEGAHGFVVSEYAAVAAFIASYDGARPSCILIRLLKDHRGVAETLRRLAEHSIHLPVIVLADHADIPTVVECMKLGASDFLELPIDLEDLRQRIEDLLADDAERARTDTEIAAASRRFVNLSQRERQILDLILHGSGSKEIGRLLDISSKTVDVHRTNLMRKVGVTSVTQLVNMALSIRHHRKT